MSQPYNNCLYQFYFRIINNSAIAFTTATFYDYLNTYYSISKECPVIGRIESTQSDKKLLIIPFACYTSSSSLDHSVLVYGSFIEGNNISGTPSDYVYFSCRAAVTACNDRVIPLLNL